MDTSVAQPGDLHVDMKGPYPRSVTTVRAGGPSLGVPSCGTERLFACADMVFPPGFPG